MRSRPITVNKAKSSHSILRTRVHSTQNISQPGLRHRKSRRDDEEWKGQGRNGFFPNALSLDGLPFPPCTAAVWPTEANEAQEIFCYICTSYLVQAILRNGKSFASMFDFPAGV
jgi:hypothetical protein